METQRNHLRQWDQADAVKAGRTLRRARQYAKKDIADIAQALHVPADIIEDLEQGDWSTLPGDTYAKGYMRRYAEVVGIDAPEAATPSRTAEQVKVSRVKRLALNLRETPIFLRQMMVLIAIILSIALVTWSVLEETKQRVTLNIVKPVPERLQHLL